VTDPSRQFEGKFRRKPSANTGILEKALNMIAIPGNDAEWAAKLACMKEDLPKQNLSQPPMPLAVNGTIDHTLLSTPIEESQIDKLCAEACEYDFGAVCVRLQYVARAVSQLKGTKTAVACVVAFPEGTHETSEKVREAKEAVEQGATELDMVIRYNLLKEGRYTEIYQVRRQLRHIYYKLQGCTDMSRISLQCAKLRRRRLS
jgi:deoxyribose-phosphate aldolase